MGALVVIEDGPDAGKSATTDSKGAYSIAGLQQTTFTIGVSAPGYVSATARVILPSVGTVLTELDFSALEVDVIDPLDIEDTLRPVAGATVTLVDGPLAGTSTTTDASGKAAFPSSDFNAQARIRVQKDDYDTVDSVMPILSGSPAGAGRITVVLKAPDLIQFAPGKYALTIAASGNCAGTFPPDVLTRTYTGQLAPLTGYQTGEGYSFAPDVMKNFYLPLNVVGHDTSFTTGDLPIVDPDGQWVEFSSVTTITETTPSLVTWPVSSYYIKYQGVECVGYTGTVTLTYIHS